MGSRIWRMRWASFKTNRTAITAPSRTADNRSLGQRYLWLARAGGVDGCSGKLSFIAARQLTSGNWRKCKLRFGATPVSGPVVSSLALPPPQPERSTTLTTNKVIMVRDKAILPTAPITSPRVAPRPARAAGLNSLVGAVVAFAPPAVEDAQVQAAVTAGLHAAGAGGLERAARVVQPDVAAAHHLARDVDVVVLDEHEPPREAR